MIIHCLYLNATAESKPAARKYLSGERQHSSLPNTCPATAQLLERSEKRNN